jgi:TRAP-type mannitol/chloroaromatic compound transport system substrate-binding protein
MKRCAVLIVVIVAMVACSEAEKVAVDDTCLSNGGKSYKWNMVTTWPKNFPGLGMAGENFS